MDTSISIIGVVLAAASSFVIGSIWYSPSVLLKPWMKMTGTTDADMKKSFGSSMAVIGVASLITAYVLAHFISYSSDVTGTTGVMAGLETALWAGLGLAVTSIITAGAMEPRDKMVMVITSGNRLVTLLVMGAILGAFM
jgi:Protein of unknown function (DUF1761)